MVRVARGLSAELAIGSIVEFCCIAEKKPRWITGRNETGVVSNFTTLARAWP